MKIITLIISGAVLVMSLFVSGCDGHKHQHGKTHIESKPQE